MSKYNQNPANPTPPYQQQVFQFIASVVGQNNIIAIPVEFVRFTGDYNTAAILNQLIYWQGKGDDPDGWIYKTYDQWETEVALSKYQANRAVKTLTTMGILETKVTRVKLKNGMYGDKAVHYMFNEETFVDLFGKQLNIVDSKDPSLSKVKELNHGKCSNSSFLPLITETSFNDYSNQKNPPLPPLKIKLKKPIPPPAADAPKATMEKALVALILLIPESMRKPSTVAKLAKAIENGTVLPLPQLKRLSCLPMTGVTARL